MRKLLIIGALLVAVAGLLAFALANLDSLIEHNKDIILARVSDRLGREVDVEKIGVSVWGGIGARLSQFRVADDPAFSSEDFVHAEAVRVNVALWPLLSREMQVTRIILQKPQIRIIRDTRGRFNVHSLTRTDASEPSKATDQATAPQPVSQPDASLPLLVALFDIEDGAISFYDRQTGAELQVSQIELRAHDLSVDTLMRVKFEAALNSNRRNIFVDLEAGPLGPDVDQIDALPLRGSVDIRGVDPKPLLVTLVGKDGADTPSLLTRFGVTRPVSLGADFSGRLGELDLRDVTLRAPMFGSDTPNVTLTGRLGPVSSVASNPLAQATLDVRLSGSIGTHDESSFELNAQVEHFQPLRAEYRLDAPRVRLRDFGLDAEGTSVEAVKASGQLRQDGSSFHHTGRLTSGRGRLATLEYTNLSLESLINEQNVQIRALRLAALQGTLTGSADYGFGFRRPRFSARARAAGMELAAFSRTLTPTGDIAARGTASFEVDVSGTGDAWANIVPSLNGQGTAEIVDGAVVDFNIAETLLASLSGLQGLSIIVPENVRAKYPAIFTSQDTVFDEFNVRFRVARGKMHIEPLRIAARDFLVCTEGTLNFQQQLDLHARLTLSRPLSDDLLRGIKEFKAIASDNGRLTLPFTVGGVLSDPRPSADAVLRSLFRKGALDILRDTFGGNILDKLPWPLPKNGRTAEPSHEHCRMPSPKAKTDRSPTEPRPQEGLIRKGIDALFGR